MRRVAILMCLALLACEETEGPNDAAEGRTCGADVLQHMIGSDLEQIRAASPPNLRVLRPGDLQTLEYRRGRLNAQVDAANRVVRLYCG